MRVLVVDTYYQPFLEAHYRERPELAEATYADQLRALMERSFGTSDAYALHLSEHGHEAEDVIVNCAPLQLRWAEENGHGRLAAMLRRVPAGRPRAAGRQLVLRRILAAQLRQLRPELVYLQDMHWATPADLVLLKRDGRRLVGQIASAAPARSRLRAYDLVVTSFPHFVERIRHVGVACEYLPIAFDERVLERLRARGVDARPDTERAYGATFVGALDPTTHARGTALLERACAETPLDVWGYGADALPPGSAILERYRGQAWGLDMYELLARSHIVVNRHIDAAEGHSNNMRLYEATGVGALLVTDRGINLPDLFEPEREVVAYDGPDDLVAKLRHFAEHPDEARAIAAAGQRRTLAEHTYSKRIKQLSALLVANFT